MGCNINFWSRWGWVGSSPSSWLQGWDKPTKSIKSHNAMNTILGHWILNLILGQACDEPAAESQVGFNIQHVLRLHLSRGVWNQVAVEDSSAINGSKVGYSIWNWIGLTKYFSNHNISTWPLCITKKTTYQNECILKQLHTFGKK